MKRLVVPLALAALLLVVRRDLVVRAIRWLDRRGGITSRRGEDGRPRGLTRPRCRLRPACAGLLDTG